MVNNTDTTATPKPAPVLISPKMKITPVEASRQYFRELMFLRALEEVD